MAQAFPTFAAPNKASTESHMRECARVSSLFIAATRLLCRMTAPFFRWLPMKLSRSHLSLRHHQVDHTNVAKQYSTYRALRRFLFKKAHDSTSRWPYSRITE